MIRGALILIRPLNVAITMAAVYAAGIISAPDYYSRPLLMAVIASGFVAAYGNILNDIFDLELDRKAKPFRPLPSGEISFMQAGALAIVCAMIALILSILINHACLLVASIAIILLTFYTPYFKGFGYWGNVLIAAVSALALIYGAIAVGNAVGGIIPATFAFLFHFVREIIKDMEDYQYDREFAIRTGAVKYGLKASSVLAIGISILLIVATFIPFIAGTYGVGYLTVVIMGMDIPLMYVAIRLISSPDKSTYRLLSGLMKALMPVGLVAIFLGSRGI
ncbi:MAG: UbiA family prenyltransferase [candidate division Zixibacteria bacterium]|nr:UbiA family prenyltransferase [candidate division Zixibacteria bacterium]